MVKQFGLFHANIVVSDTINKLKAYFSQKTDTQPERQTQKKVDRLTHIQKNIQTDGHRQIQIDRRTDRLMFCVTK